MLSWVRRLQKNWLARGFFVLLIVIFVFWGISNVVSLIGNNSAVAHIAGKPVDITVLQAAYQTQLDQARQKNPNPDFGTRQQIADAALGEVLRQQTMRLEAGGLGVAAPDSSIRAVLDGIPAFQTNGTFNKATFTQVLQANNRTPDEFIGAVRDDLTNRQILLPVITGAAPPAELVNQLFSFISEQRFAEIVNIPTAGQAHPKPPAQAVLQRFWRNHPALFTAPEYRTVKIVILSPALLAPNEFVSDDDIAAAYARATAGLTSVPLRSVEVITTSDAAKAASLAASWRNADDWPSVQALAKADGANPVELDNAQQSEFPSTVLGAAVFAALPGEVTGPIQGPFGLFVFKVTGTSTSVPMKAAMAATLRSQLQLQKAQADVAQDVDNVQDALAGQTALDKLPGNLGLTALQGTLDANGNAADGTPAPIPGGADLKTAIVKAVFATQPNQPAQLQTGPAGSYFALSVGSIIPPALLPYNQVKSQVLAAWTADQLARAAQTKAANLLAAVNAGQQLDVAASHPQRRPRHAGGTACLLAVQHEAGPGHHAADQRRLCRCGIGAHPRPQPGGRSDGFQPGLFSDGEIHAGRPCRKLHRCLAGPR